MRYVLIDRILSLEAGRRLSAIKNVTASDGLVTRYARGFCALPASMVLEAMAQAAGLLVVATAPQNVQPVLAKVQPFTAYGQARPGDQLHLQVELEALRDQGCRARVTADVHRRRLADAVIYLALVMPDSVGADGNAALRVREGLADLYPGWFSADRRARGTS